MVDLFPVNEREYKFAVDLYADKAINGITFNNYSSVEEFKRMVDQLPFQGLLTNTDESLYLAANKSFSTEQGGRDPSLGFAKNALLITGIIYRTIVKYSSCAIRFSDFFRLDGNPRNMVRTKEAALYAKQRGLVLTIIGVGAYISKDNMLAIASYPSCARVNMIPDFAPLAAEGEYVSITCYILI